MQVSQCNRPKCHIASVGQLIRVGDDIAQRNILRFARGFCYAEVRVRADKSDRVRIPRQGHIKGRCGCFIDIFACIQIRLGNRVGGTAGRCVRHVGRDGGNRTAQPNISVRHQHIR